MKEEKLNRIKDRIKRLELEMNNHLDNDRPLSAF